MRRTCLAIAVILAIACTEVVTAQRAPGGRGPSEFDAFYTLGPDSLPRDGVPKGEVRGPFKLPSKAFEGVEHSYWIYVPAQYDASREASLMVFNDGATYLRTDGSYRAANVLDNLIYRGDIPVMLGAFIDPGVNVADGRSIRQEEYDTLSDRYSKVIVDELLPALPDGHHRRLRNPVQRQTMETGVAIQGVSVALHERHGAALRRAKAKQVVSAPPQFVRPIESMLLKGFSGHAA
jgi:enterochelin esterase family protein